MRIERIDYLSVGMSSSVRRVSILLALKAILALFMKPCPPTGGHDFSLVRFFSSKEKN